MKINKLTLKNFRQYHKEEIQLPDSNFVVLLGVNGAGKTTVLDGMAMCISHIIGRLTSSRDKYSIKYSIQAKDIQNGQTESRVILDLEINQQKVQIDVSKGINQSGSSYGFVPEFPFNELKESLLKNGNTTELPLIVYYRANRTMSIKDNSSEISFYSRQLNGYRFANSENASAFTPLENWFLNEESIENEKKVELKNFDFKSKSLVPVREAIEIFLSELNDEIFTNLRGKRSDDSKFNYGDAKSGELLIDKGGDTIKLNQLSSGERSIIYLVLDISIRLTILNLKSPESLNKHGIVLIDELEMHLHPKWQRNLIPSLKSVFPNIQFIVTTHSPQIISSVSDSDIIILGEKTHFSASSNPLGRDSNGILEEIFDTSSRPTEVKETLNEIFISLNEGDIDKSNQLIEKLNLMIGSNDPVLRRIASIKERLNILNFEKDN